MNTRSQPKLRSIQERETPVLSVYEVRESISSCSSASSVYLKTVQLKNANGKISPSSSLQSTDSTILPSLHEENSSSTQAIQTSPKAKQRGPFSLSKVLVIIAMIFLGICAVGVGITAVMLIVLRPTTTTIITTTTTSTTSTTTSTTNAVCSTMPNTWYTTSATIPGQCINYTVDTDATRRYSYTASTSYCDNSWPFSNRIVWMRFQGAAGSMVVKIPISNNFCGTFYTGWYAGNYPLTVYTTATSIACFYFSSVNQCGTCRLMSVTNCGSFYVFGLVAPPFCNCRYCTS
ncbi:unnamed protein product [Adineta ricciae]|uniref:Uncharacterized protein n=1 Tax=Adineta ricciae TaxID=249248 RepID=A0A815X6E4_ADIRI|nr:unnamed protein product [Adineta ricciae]